jgi:hypothetical protein
VGNRAVGRSDRHIANLKRFKLSRTTNPCDLDWKIKWVRNGAQLILPGFFRTLCISVRVKGEREVGGSVAQPIPLE